MKQLFTFVLAAIAFVACTQNDVEELSANREALPETLTVGFEGGDTRIELNDALKTVWTEGDEVSAFYQSYENTRWAFQGATGDRSGELRLVSGDIGQQTMDNIIVAYPYDANYRINIENRALHASLPAVQSYKDGSYGAEGNIMVAAGEFTQFTLKSVVGWLRVELTGEGEVVESVKVRGNNGEQVAGLCYIDAADASVTLASDESYAEEDGEVSGNLNFDGSMLTEVVLNCGDGVGLGAEATAFYVALLPQTFEKGMTIEINYANGNSQPLVCENSITISRNHISPIGIEANEETDVPTNQLWYTASALVKPNSSAFNVAIVSNEWDEATGKGIITFDGELTTIGDWAFSWRDSLTSVTIGDSVTTIGDEAFGWCESLTSVTIGNSVTTIGASAFSYCSNLAEFKGKFAADGGRCLIKDNAIIAYAEASGTTYTIPDSVKTIGENAFAGCHSLTSVTIPNSVTTIGDYAFSDCDSLKSVTIGDSVTTIGDEAFAYCYSLTSVTIGDSVTTIGDLAFYNCSSLTSVYCKATTPPTLGDNVFWGYDNNWNDVMLACDIYVPAESVEAYKTATNWSEYAADIVGYDFETGEEVAISNKLFYTATALVEPYDASAFNAAIVSNEWNEVTGKGVITFDGELTKIGYEAFYWCSSLTSVTIPDSVTTIGNYAFAFCDSLTSVTIPDSVTTIGYEAFYSCDSLTSVTIPDSVTSIGVDAFGACSNLAEFKGKFAADGGRCLIKDNAIIAYANASGTTYTIPDSVTTIGYMAFWCCESLTSVTIPDSVTTIGGSAFSNCYSLTSVTIPDSVTTIGDSAFASCDSLTNVTIPDSVTTIGDGAFYWCSSLAEFKGKFAADGGRCLIKDNTLIAYANASGTTYTIPDSVTTIGNDAFAECESLTSVTIGDSVTTIGNDAFWSCDSLTSVTIGDSVTTIGNKAFYHCRSLTSVTIPDSVTTIGEGAFRYCSSLTSVYCEATTPPTLGGSTVFDNNADGRKIYVPAASVEAYKAAENWSEYAADIVGYNFETGEVVE